MVMMVVMMVVIMVVMMMMVMMMMVARLNMEIVLKETNFSSTPWSSKTVPSWRSLCLITMRVHLVGMKTSSMMLIMLVAKPSPTCQGEQQLESQRGKL